MNRESIYAVLFALVPSEFATVSRTLKHWEDVPPEGMPALFQSQADEEITAKPNLPPLVQGGVNWWLYVRSESGSPSTIINPLVDACFAALSPVGDALTLGGLVDQCYIDGKIETDEGTLGSIAVAKIPIIFIVGG